MIQGEEVGKQREGTEEGGTEQAGGGGRKNGQFTRRPLRGMRVSPKQLEK